MNTRFAVLTALVMAVISAGPVRADTDPCYDAVQQGRFRDAIALCTKQTESGADERAITAAYRLRGIAYLATGQPDLAIADLDIAIERNGSDAAAYSNRGAAYMSQGRFFLALADLDKAIEL